VPRHAVDVREGTGNCVLMSGENERTGVVGDGRPNIAEYQRQSHALTVPGPRYTVHEAP